MFACSFILSTSFQIAPERVIAAAKFYKAKNGRLSSKRELLQLSKLLEFYFLVTMCIVLDRFIRDVKTANRWVGAEIWRDK